MSNLVGGWNIVQTHTHTLFTYLAIDRVTANDFITSICSIIIHLSWVVYERAMLNAAILLCVCSLSFHAVYDVNGFALKLCVCLCVT